MTDLLLRNDLERESHRVTLAPGAAERMFERRDAGTAAVVRRPWWSASR